MDEKMARMAQQLKNNPALLGQLMQSQDGQALMRMLSDGSRGASLQQAAQSAANGDTAALAAMMQQIMSSPGGAALVEHIRKTVKP
ncbi:hypothetical protein [Dysosmobacter sp.]|uniref:hypothetical protein n=1 Tax=Dysosmobacter sp. TaxID=2591382 RepID=UPI003FD79392